MLKTLLVTFHNIAELPSKRKEPFSFCWKVVRKDWTGAFDDTFFFLFISCQIEKLLLNIPPLLMNGLSQQSGLRRKQEQSLRKDGLVELVAIIFSNVFRLNNLR